MVVASGGLNQQRNQIVDAVVIARILEAALVVPVLQVNLIWGDERYTKHIYIYKHTLFSTPERFIFYVFLVVNFWTFFTFYISKGLY